MTAVSILVPYRPDGAERDRNWSWVRTWWARHFPDWQVVVGAAPDGPWCKALAVRDALDRADGDHLVVADADVFMPPTDLRKAMTLLAALDWVVPHRRVVRLTDWATKGLLEHGTVPVRDTRNDGVESAYKGRVGGGMMCLRRSMYEICPMDPRFKGWGQEDESWGLALGVMSGNWTRLVSPLYHLWHPPQDRLTRATGSAAGAALYRRYRAAATRPAMADLLGEVAAGVR